MSAPSKEEIATWTSEMLEEARSRLEVWNRANRDGTGSRGMIRPEGAYVVLAIDAENERLRSERAECLELLETAPLGGTTAGSYKAVVEWTEARRALLAKLSRDATEPCWYCERPAVERRKERLSDKPGTERDVCEQCAEDLRKGDELARRERLRDGRDE